MYAMYIRHKQNKSGSTSIQIISKDTGRYCVIKTIGCSSDPAELKRLLLEAKYFLHRPDNSQKILIQYEKREAKFTKNVIQNLSNSNIHSVGPELILGPLFDRIGFNIIPSELFRHLVITRLTYPTSKLKTVDYLYRYQGKNISIDSIYRFLDTLQSSYKDKVEKVAYEYTKRILNNVTVVFYDMTTLYFETEDEDDLRKIGFSKDGKFQSPQIMIGLLVGEGGYPIGYDIFKGNTFEGHTLLPILKKFQKKYGFSKPVVIADAALLSKKNLTNLSLQEYQFILGGRIKNEPEKLKSKILLRSKGMRHGDYFSMRRKDGLRLIITYSDKRAKKDVYNRKKGLRKLREKVQSGRLTKSSINNRGYNKYLRLQGQMTIEIDEEKIEQDKAWDGLRGYVTNTRLWTKTVIANYRHLWQIENAFRISKTDLRVRPIYHRLRGRIEAHVCIAFVAYTIYKELERLLCKYDKKISVKRAIELTHNMYELEYTLPDNGEIERTLLKMDTEQQELYDVIHKLS
jgi:transposase